MLSLDLLTLHRSYANEYDTYQCYEVWWQHPDRYPHSELYFVRFQVLGLDLLMLHRGYANEYGTNQCYEVWRQHPHRYPHSELYFV